MCFLFTPGDWDHSLAPGHSWLLYRVTLDPPTRPTHLLGDDHCTFLTHSTAMAPLGHPLKLLGNHHWSTDPT
jgi:hypothetical protein